MKLLLKCTRVDENLNDFFCGTKLPNLPSDGRVLEGLPRG
jgi:hypothetical protein